MKTLEKIIIWVVSVTQLVSGGCTQKQIVGYETVDKVVVSPQAISPAGVKIAVQSSSLSVDDLIVSSDSSIEYLKFREKYGGYSTGIIQQFEHKNLDLINTLVKELADRLERDSNPYAKEYLEKVKNFNYLIYEINIIKQEISEKKIGPFEVVWLGSWGLNDFFGAPITLMLGKPLMYTTEAYKRLPDEKKEQSVIHSFSKIKVTPYSGTKEVVERHIPIQMLNQDLQNQPYGTRLF